MNNTTINNGLKNIIITGLAIITFIPLYVNNSYFFPFITGKAFVFRILVELIFALWLILALREKGTSVVGTSQSVIPKVNYLTIVVTIFAVVALIADLFGLNPLRSIWSNFERMEGWMTIIHLWAYFIVMSSVLTTKKSWNNFFNVSIITGLLVAFYGLFQFFGWAATHQGNRVDASLGNSAYMAVYMLINAFIALYMTITNSKLYGTTLSGIYGICFVFFSFILFQTATRGTILGWIAAVLISAAIYAVFGKKDNGQSNLTRGLAGGLIVLVIAIGGLFYEFRDAKWIQNNQVLGRLASISISDTKTQARGFIWPMAINGVFETPKTTIIGVGQENFNYIFNSHYNPKMWMHEQWFDRAHSVFIDWLVAGGLIGLLSYLALYLFSLVYIIKSNLSIGEKSVFIGLLVGYGIHNVFVFDNQTSYVMFFTVLAYIKTLKDGKDFVLFKNSDKQPTEDGIVVRDYVFLPVIVIGLIASIYLINVRPISVNKDLILGLTDCNNAKTLSLAPYKEALSYGQTMADQEIREQYLSCATGVISSQQIPIQTKMEFYALAKDEINKQIATTPGDARIYIIGGSFYNAINDFKSATPLLEKANQLSPNKQTIIYELAGNYLNVGSTTEGIALFKQAYDSATDNQTAKLQYVSALVKVGKESEAKKLFSDDKDIFLDPKVIDAYMFNKQYSKAIEAYKALIAKDPENIDAYSPLAYAYILNGQDDQAIATLKGAGAKFPAIKAQTDGIIKQIQDGKFKNLK